MLVRGGNSFIGRARGEFHAQDPVAVPPRFLNAKNRIHDEICVVVGCFLEFKCHLARDF